MSNIPKVKKLPTLLAIGDMTIRINPRSTPTSYLQVQIMQPPVWGEQNSETVLVKAAQTTEMWLSMEDAKLLADAFYAQDALDLIE